MTLKSLFDSRQQQRIFLLDKLSRPVQRPYKLPVQRYLGGRGQLKCDGTRAETRFRLSAKRASPFKSARGASVQSTTGSRGVRITGSNAGYTVFRGSVKSTDSRFRSQVSACGIYS